MKHLIVTICLGALILFLESCKKHKSAEDTTSLVGTWELRQVQNEMTPIKDYSPGNGNILRFSDATYERYTNGSLTGSGPYTVVRDTSVMTAVGLAIPPGQFTNRIIFNGNPTSPITFMEIAANRLTLLSGYFPTDGGARLIYERQPN